MESYKRIMDENGSILVDPKYKPNVTTTKLTKAQLKEIKDILNQILPVPSERDYRVQKMTNKKLYELYDKQIKGKHVLKSYFFYQILAKKKIHHFRI